ncbi:hypothetical protein [Pedobacter agri]|uniref:Uncharacterized protein n=1 Tax=Pedobacter agri TaxID=454586 RepID=A0A9X3DJI5_9SPHI|nr:hypothetical protein [Pedobacter agri]MCX3267375.1 hypothetical protein [Pedobacter agri]
MEKLITNHDMRKSYRKVLVATETTSARFNDANGFFKKPQSCIGSKTKTFENDGTIIVTDTACH